MSFSLEMAKSIIFNLEELVSRLPIAVPEEWPTDEIKSILPFYIEKLEKDPSILGWGPWLIIDYHNREIIGNAGFKGNPDVDGVIEVGYQILKNYQKQGYGYEAVYSLINWAFLHDNVKSIVAECDDSNIGSIRILEKLGMRCVRKDPPFLLWELNRSIQ